MQLTLTDEAFAVNFGWLYQGIFISIVDRIIVNRRLILEPGILRSNRMVILSDQRAAWFWICLFVWEQGFPANETVNLYITVHQRLETSHRTSCCVVAIAHKLSNSQESNISTRTRRSFTSASVIRIKPVNAHKLLISARFGSAG